MSIKYATQTRQANEKVLWYGYDLEGRRKLLVQSGANFLIYILKRDKEVLVGTYSSRAEAEDWMYRNSK
jgi:hypothetical protein